jgi:hypothetical protein
MQKYISDIPMSFNTLGFNETVANSPDARFLDEQLTMHQRKWLKYQIKGPSRYLSRQAALQPIALDLAFIDPTDTNFAGLRWLKDETLKQRYRDIPAAGNIFRDLETADLVDITGEDRLVGALEVANVPRLKGDFAYLYVNQRYSDLFNSRINSNISFDSVARLFGSWALYKSFENG